MGKVISIIFFYLLLTYIGAYAGEQGVSNLLLDNKDTSKIIYQPNKNLFLFDLDVVSASVAYARKLNEKWYLGGGIGLGYSINYLITTKSSFGVLKIANARLYSLCFPFKFLQLESGVQALFIMWGGVGEEDGLSDGIIGFYVFPAVGWKYVWVGFQTLIGYNNVLTSKFELLITPVILRINIPF